MPQSLLLHPRSHSRLLCGERARLRLFAASLALFLTFFAFTTPLYADTIIINTSGDSGPDTFGETYIEAQLANGDFTLNTDDAGGGGPNEIRVMPGVAINWTSGSSLTLLADANIVLSGTIQHNGPADGSGGVTLIADNDNTGGGDVLLGVGNHSYPIAVGSRHALTRVDGENVRLRAGNNATFRYAHIGYRTVNAGETYSVTGAISVTADISVTALGGNAEAGYVQIGHGGGSDNNASDGIMTGTVSIVAGDSISFTAGSGVHAYAQVGNGGWYIDGTFGGNHSLQAITGDIQFSSMAGSGGANGYAQVGNGGELGVGHVTTGDMSLVAGRDIIFTGGEREGTYALIGNGGRGSYGAYSGNHMLVAQTGDIRLESGSGPAAFAQVGNGTQYVNENHSGDLTLMAGDTISLTGGSGYDAYLQIGNGGNSVFGNAIGSITMTAQTGDILAAGGIGYATYVQVGNGGYNTTGLFTGNQQLTAAGDIHFEAGPNESYVHVGNGGRESSGNHTGDQQLVAGGNITFLASPTSPQYTYAQVGNGGLSPGVGSGSLVGNQTLAAAGDIRFEAGNFKSFAQVGNGGHGEQGSHSGNQQLSALGSILFLGGLGQDAYAQVGNGGFDADGTHTGSVTLTATQSITFTGGISTGAYAQAGHGGNTTSGNHSGNHTLTSQTGNIAFTAGDAVRAYAQIGNGGIRSNGNHSGNHTLNAETNILFTGGDSNVTYAQVGNGGYEASGELSGSHRLTATQSILFTAGSGVEASAYVGNAGEDSSGSRSGDHTLTTLNGDIAFTAGPAEDSFVQVGNGGESVNANHSGNHTLTAAGSITFTAGSGEEAYAQVGNGGDDAEGDHSGSHTLTAANNVAMIAGENFNTYAQVGNGGYEASGNHLGNHLLTAGGKLFVVGGSDESAYAQVGNGGYSASGEQSGSMVISATQAISVAAGSGLNAYAQVGHGGVGADDARTGNVTLWSGGDLTLHGAHIGHATTTGANAITEANTFIAVGQSTPLVPGNGEIRVTHTPSITTIFNSAPMTNSGELRFYVPSRADVLIAANTPMNSELFPGTVPDARVAGLFLFEDGPYIQDYSFYFSVPSDLNLTKEAAPSGTLLPGQPVTYTLAFSNVGSNAATNIVLTDTLPFLGLLNVTLDSDLDSGVTITQTGSAPNLAWQISDLAPGQGGVILVRAVATSQVSAPIGFANSAAITGTLDITPANNSAEANSSITVPLVGFTPTAYEVMENAGSAMLTATLSFTNPYTSTVVNYLSSDGTANAGSDYTAQSSTFSIPVGQSSVTLTVPITDNTVLETDEYFTVTLTAAAGAGPYFDVQATITILDDENALTLAPLNADQAEGNSGSTAFTFVVTRTGSLSSIVTVDYAVSGEADAADFAGNTLPSGSITFNSGDVSQIVTATVAGDTILEADEPFTVTLSNASSNAAITDSTATGSINNDDSASLSINDATLFEGNSGTTVVTLTVTLSGSTSAPFTVNYATLDGSATEDSDYGDEASTLNFAGSDGETQSIVLLVLGDSTLEGDETFTVNLSNVQGLPVTLADESGQVTILNDDSTLAISALDADNAEGNSGTTPFTFVVNRTGYLTTTTTVDYAVSGSANAADFDGNVLPSGSVTFNSGDSTQVVSVPVQGDLLAESDEAFIVTLSNASPLSSITTMTANGTIRNDDVAPALTVSKTPSVALARVGETIIYSYRITNSGGLTFTALSAVDDLLGTVPLDKSNLALGEVATGQLTYTVQAGDESSSPLVNTVIVTGTPVVGSDVVETAEASVDLVLAAFSFAKTVGIQGILPECTGNSTMQVPISTTVVYCFTITNTGSEPLTTHTLEDSQLGTVLDNVSLILAPGASYSTTVTRTLYASVTNTAAWTAGYAGSEAEADAVSIAAVPVGNNDQATVIISDDDDDQDSDGIPDNIEQAADVDNDNVPSFLDDDSDGDERPDTTECATLPCQDTDGDGVPNFLDPNDATGLDPDAQPGDRRRTFLPSVAGE